MKKARTKKTKGKTPAGRRGGPVPIVDLPGVEVTYDKATDVLAIQFGEQAKRSWSYAYEEFLIVHGGTVQGHAVLQGITLINAKELRRKALARRGVDASDEELAEDFEEIPRELADFYKEVETTVVGLDVVVSHRRRAGEPGVKILEWVTPAIGFAHDLAGRLVAIVMRNAAFAVDRSALKDLFDMFFDALLGPPEAEHVDPKRSAFGNAIVEVLAPMLAA